MRRFLTPILVFTLTIAVFAASAKRPDRILLKPKANVAPAKIRQAHKNLGTKVHREYKRLGGLQVIELPKGLSVEKALTRYRKLGLFEYVEPDRVRHIVATPNDPYYLDNFLYGLDAISAPAAWDIRSNAENVIVAVLDTGVRYDHEDLASNIWVNPCVNCPVNGFVYSNDVHGINAITETGDPMDDNGHGTHCAGIIGAVGNNGLGVCGVAWRVQIMPLKFLDSSGSGYDSDAVECIDYAIARGAHIMSNSWGGNGDSPPIHDAIQAARDAGIIFVAAAGNNGSNNDTSPFIPAAFDVDNIVAVAATDWNDNLAFFSNYGRNTVHLAAPGVGILSTYRNSTNDYEYDSGTSMACPHVSGAFALLKAQFPSESYTQLIHRILGNVDPLAVLSNVTVSGGRLNVYDALTQTPRPLADFRVSQAGGYAVTFANLTMGAVTNASWDFGDGSTLSSLAGPTHTYTNPGTFSVTMSVAATNGTSTRTRSVTVGRNYYVRSTPCNWIDPTGMTPLNLTDDSVSSGQTIPFPFVYYGQTNTTLYVGSNGLLGFDVNNLFSPYHSTLPYPGAPTNTLAPYWSDLNPSVAGSIYIGCTGSSPNRVAVISWVGVPNFNDNSAAFTFQAQLYETSNDIVFQYQEVQPTNSSFGSSRAATVGIEDPSGTIARQVSFDGSTLLTNHQAILFTLVPSAPTLNATSPASPGISDTPVIGGVSEPLSTVLVFTNGLCSTPTAITTVTDQTGSFSIPISVTTNSITIFSAQAIDLLGSTSACSSTVVYQQLDPLGDADGDGVDNADEIATGADPLNAASVPRIATAGFNTNDVIIAIQSTAGRTYQLQRSTNLCSSCWEDVGVPATGDSSILTLTDPGAASMIQRFYRVKISF